MCEATENVVHSVRVRRLIFQPKGTSSGPARRRTSEHEDGDVATRHSGPNSSLPILLTHLTSDDQLVGRYGVTSIPTNELSDKTPAS